jgi:hypothetical protein
MIATIFTHIFLPASIVLSLMLSDQISENNEKDFSPHSPDMIEKIDLEHFAVNKTIPDEIREVTLMALSHFPELLDVDIEFVLKKKIKGSVMQAQPKVGSLLFNSRDNRKYKINISRYLELDDEWLPIEEVPENVLLGWIGHELGHVMDYLEKSRLGLISFGFRYVTSNAFVTQAEITADSYAVAGGLGNNLVDTKNFILNNDRLPEEYRNKIRDLYMSPGEIMTLVDVEEEDEKAEK